MGVAQQRARMVREQIEARGIHDPALLEAMRQVPREQFVPAASLTVAYADGPLPIGFQQTISQPYIVALTAAALRLGPTDRVLEVGAGSGYAAAVLARLAGEVYAVERIPELAQAAEARLAALGVSNAHVVAGDGSEGLSRHAPYDAIAVAAAAAEVPPALLTQLAPGGRLVIPVGEEHGYQELFRFTRQHNGDVQRESLGGVRFVPLITAHASTQHA